MAGSAPYVQANTRGVLHPADAPVISPLDRGFLYGDAVYEVWRTYEAVVFAFREHWRRLEASARALHMDLPFASGEVWPELARTAAAYRAATGDSGELYVRLHVTRGAGAIGLDPALADEPLWTFLVRRLPRLPEEKLLTGVRVAIARGLRRNHPSTLNPLWKTGNYLNNLLALREAKAAGADEVLMLNLDGDIAESSTMNIAFVAGSEVLTPPLEAGILAGITRDLLLKEVAPRAGVRARETPVRPADLDGFQEAFFLSTTRDLTPIAAIDHVRFGVGPATVTARLKRAFQESARDYAAAHPEYRVA